MLRSCAEADLKRVASAQFFVPKNFKKTWSDSVTNAVIYSRKAQMRKCAAIV